MKAIQSAGRYFRGQWEQIKAEPVFTIIVWLLFFLLVLQLPEGEGAAGSVVSLLAAFFALGAVIFFLQPFRRRGVPTRWETLSDLAQDLVFGFVFLTLYLRIGYEGILPGPWWIYFLVIPVSGSLLHAIIGTVWGRDSSSTANA